MFPIPASALDEDRISIVGMSGSGKTYAAMSAVEILLEQKSRVVIVDPLGVWWGLRVQADGKTPAFNLPIFGGAHGDLALTETAGSVIGETVAGMAESCIVDLSQIGTKAGERRFMLAFLTALYRGINGSQVHVIFDEADMWAPQRLLDKDGEAAKLLGMMETIVRRGRVRGFIPCLITQRPAVLSKDVLSQSDGIISFKLTSSQDRDAIGAWIEGQADKADQKVFLSSLPKLHRGTGIAWFPARAILQTATFPVRKTFDSSRAPRRGETRTAAVLTALNLGQLRERLASVEAETKANDPKALRQEIAELKAELAGNGPDQTALQGAYNRGRIDGHAAALTSIAGIRNRLADRAIAVEQRLSALRAEIEAIDAAPAPAAPVQRPPRANAQPPAAAPARPLPEPQARATSSADADDLTTPQRRVMESLAFWRVMGEEKPTREQVAAIAGYKPGSGNFNNIMGTLSTAGKTGRPEPGRLSLAVDFPPLGSAKAKHMLWSVLDGPQRRLIEAALQHPGDLPREQLAIAASYAPGSGNFNNIVGSLTTMDVLQRTGVGRIGLSDWVRMVL